MSDQGTVRDFASGLRAERGEEDRLLSVYEAAAMTLQNPGTVRRWISDGLLPAQDYGKLGLRVRESDVEQWVRSHFEIQGRKPANKGLSSNQIDKVEAGSPSEVKVAGAGWPFHGRTNA